jgi:hypothetical protein
VSKLKTKNAGFTMGTFIDIPYNFYARFSGSFGELMRKSGHTDVNDMISEAIDIYDFYQTKVLANGDLLAVYHEEGTAEPVEISDRISAVTPPYQLVEKRTFPVPEEEFDVPPDDDDLVEKGNRLTKVLVLYEDLIESRLQHMKPGIYRTATGIIDPVNFISEAPPVKLDPSAVPVPGHRGPLLH